MGYAVPYEPSYKRKPAQRKQTDARKAFENKLRMKVLRALPALETQWAQGAGVSQFSKRNLLRGELATIREGDLQYLIAEGHLPRPDSRKQFNARAFIMMARQFTGFQEVRHDVA